MNLHHKTFGKGHPIVILHGLFGMSDNWQWIAKQLSNDFSVYIVDLRNHGRSPHLDDFGYALMAEDLRAFMLDHWLHEAHLIGHSMGGKVAMQMALEYPDMVSKLVVADMAPTRYEDQHADVFKALFAVPLDRIATRQEAEAILREHIAEPGTQQFLLKNLYMNTETGKYTWKMNLPVLYQHYDKILSHELPEEQYHGQTLFIRGEQSAYILPEAWGQCLHYFPQARLETISKAGHWVHADQPMLFWEVVRAFLV